MDNTERSNGDQNHQHNGDESCILVENEISTITVIDDADEASEQDGKDLTLEDVTIDNMGEFQVIDQVGESDASESQEIAEGESSATIDNHEFIAPNNVDLDVTPIPVAPEPEKRMLIDIKFQNKKTYLAFQEEFINLVKTYYKNKIDDMDIHDDMAHNSIRVSEKIVKKSDDFLVDKTPTMQERGEATPTYRTSFGKLSNEKETAAGKKSNTSTPRNACFNCDKDSHSLRDCPEPRNMKKVNKARNEFNRKELRYHDDNENEYGHLVPGTISDDLRTALGLSPTQIPLHVYRMRLFGYPPAWIEEAKIHNSGLSLFVDKDKKQLQPGIDEGETEDNNFKYDLQKIFDYPGFNVMPEHQLVDLYKLYNTPPMLPQHSKEELIRSLGGDVLNGYKKRKLRQTDAVVDISGDDSLNERTSITVADMDIEDASDELQPLGVTVCQPSETIVKPPEPMEDGELSNDSVRSKSPDEGLLKLQRQALLAEIAESSVFLDTSAISSANNTANISTISIASSNQSQLNETIIENSENENRDNIAKDQTASHEPEETRAGHVDSTVPGCPVLPAFSPFSTLPDGLKFQEGVCDVIAFENLAESTGKYEKMKELIKKVRVFQQHHQKE